MPNASAACTASSSRGLQRLSTLPGTLAGARKTTPFGSSSVHGRVANHAGEAQYRLSSRLLGSDNLTNEPNGDHARGRTSRPSSTSSRPSHSLFLHPLPSHSNSPTHLTQYRVAGDASSSNVGPALPPANGHLATPYSLQPLRAKSRDTDSSSSNSAGCHHHRRQLLCCCSVQPARSRGNPRALLSAPIPCSEFERSQAQSSTPTRPRFAPRSVRSR